MLLSFMPTLATAEGESDEKTDYIKLKDGFWIEEAENLPYNSEIFKLVTDLTDTYVAEKMSGGAALKVISEDKTQPDVDAEADIDLSFTTDLQTICTYSVWVRNTATQNSGGNSVFMSINGAAYGYTALQSGTPTEFGWSKLGTVTVGAGGSATVRIKRRQVASIRFDKFLITSEVLYVPEGMDGTAMSGSETLPTDEYDAPTIFPTEGQHPRLFFTSDDVADIRANMNDSTNSVAKAHFEKMAAKTHSGKFNTNTGTGNWNSTVTGIAEAKAFDYAVNGNTENGRKAIDMAFNMLKTADFTGNSIPTRPTDYLIITCAKVYDWCYPLFADEDEKKEFIKLLEIRSTMTTVGYPPRSSGTITGHGSESGMLAAMLSFAVAAYDERPDIYNFVMGRIQEQYVPVRNYWYTAHSYHQGSGYIGARFYWDLVAQWIVKSMSGKDLFNAEDMQQVPYECIYITRPDGQNFRIGDDYNEYCASYGTYWGLYSIMYFYGAMLFDDPYLLDRYEATHGRNGKSFSDGGQDSIYSSTMFLILNNTSLKSKSVSELAKTTYCLSPDGTMFARTGWNFNPKDPSEPADVLAMMSIGEHHAGNHDHVDAGSFQLYYKGILASDSGCYGDGYGTVHDSQYHKTSIAHNTIDVYDPLKGTDNGQRNPRGGGEPSVTTWFSGDYILGEVLAYGYGPDKINPEYSFLKGDVAKAYDSTMVDECVRNMLFMPLDDENYPAVLVVFDNVKAKTASYQKSWLLHMQEEPTIDETAKRITAKNTKNGYNGKMEVQTLLPKSIDYEKIGGENQEFVVNGVNYPITNTPFPNHPCEKGWGRVEISPSREQLTDTFLNVITVSDADSTAAPVESTLLETQTYVGAAFLDRVCLFMKSRAKASTTMSVNIPGTGTKKVFVGGMSEGVYAIRNNGAIVSYAVADSTGGVLYFDVDGGSLYTISYEGNDFKIAGASATDETDGTTAVEAYVSGDAEQGANVTFAAYSDDRLLEIKSVAFNGTGRYTHSFEKTASHSGVKIKVFLNDKTNPLNPFAPSYEIK